MKELAFYLVKVAACSGILFLFYYIALRNKAFHQWNRFYLLISVGLSLAVPFLQFSFSGRPEEEPNRALMALMVVYDAGTYVEDMTITGGSQVSYDKWFLLGYAMISATLFILLVRSVLKILAIIKTHAVRFIHNIRFIDTQLPGTPFSFFHFIFWNRNIDLQSENGQRIFQHELVHVKEKHSIDKIFMQLVLVLFWMNPVFWLIRRELRYIHEFIADRRSVGEAGAKAFAAMILQAAYPANFNAITNQFFQTSIKRRLAMLTKKQRTGINYLSRLFALVVVTATVLAFTMRPQTTFSPASDIDKEMVVVIDAGHGMQGGKYTGAVIENVYEDEIVLSIAQKIRDLNQDKNIKIVLTRSTDELVELKERVEITRAEKADLFISIHLDARPESPDQRGVEIVLPNKNPAVLENSRLLGSAVLSELGDLFKAKGQLIAKEGGPYVLNYSPCPAILVECGFITNEADREFITDKKNHDLVALKILKAISQYARGEKTGINIKNENRLDEVVTVEGYKTGGRGPSIPIEESIGNEKKQLSGDAEILLEERITEGRENNPQDKNQEIVVTGRRLQKDTIPTQDVLTKVDVQASIDKIKWRKFLEDNLRSIVEEAAKEGAPAGSHTVYVRFIVDKDGRVSNPAVVQDPGYKLGEGVLKMIEKSPLWQPALVSKKKVNSYHTQPITFVIADDDPEEEIEFKEMTYEQFLKMDKLPVDYKNISRFVIAIRDKDKKLSTHINKGDKFDSKTRELIANTKSPMMLNFTIMAMEDGKEVKKSLLAYLIVQ